MLPSGSQGYPVNFVGVGLGLIDSSPSINILAKKVERIE